LLIRDIEFLTIYLDPKISTTCVYLRGPTVKHLELVSKMFPSVVFHVYGTGDDSIESSDMIINYDRKFEDSDIEKYTNHNNIFLISNLTSVEFYKLKIKNLHDKGIDKFDESGAPIGHATKIKFAIKRASDETAKYDLLDLEYQQKLVLAINPEKASLSFKLPYPVDGADRIIPYLNGVVYWNVWDTSTSSETMMVPEKNEDGKYEVKKWNILEYEEWLFFQNTRIRDFTTYYNPLTDSKEFIDSPELVDDYESTAEAFILMRYFQKFNIDIPPNKLNSDVVSLSRTITWILNNNNIEPGLTSKREYINNKLKVDPFREKKTKTTRVKKIGGETSKSVAKIRIPRKKKE
jgi:hypothetical protein